MVDCVSFCTWGALPAMRLSAPGGASAIVTLYGAHLVSWCTSSGAEQLFVSARSARDGQRAIRGGVPVIFPQFGERGSGLRHGFARVSTWQLGAHGAEGERVFAELHLGPGDLSPAHASAWPHAFGLTLRVALCGDAIELALDVRNDGDTAFDFASALHTYFLVEQLNAVQIGGLQGIAFEDGSCGRDALPSQSEAALAMSDKLDRVYRQLQGPLTVTCGAHRLSLAQTGFCDAVVWNPGAHDAAALADMDDDEYTRFVCVEAACIGPVSLPAQAGWRGWHRVSVEPKIGSAAD